MKKMMIFAAVVATICTAVVADIYRSAPYEPPARWDGLKLRITPSEEHTGEWNINQDEAFFAARFATVHYPEYHLSYAQGRELAKEIARTIVRFYSCTNAQIRITHVETPKPASTNLVDEIKAALATKVVTDEIVPVEAGK